MGELAAAHVRVTVRIRPTIVAVGSMHQQLAARLALGLAALAWCLELRGSWAVGAQTTSSNIGEWSIGKKSNITASIALERAISRVVSNMAPNEADMVSLATLFGQGVLRTNGTHELARYDRTTPD